MNTKLHFFGLFLGTLLVIGASVGAAVTVDQGNPNNQQFETDELVIQVVGGSQVPMYTFWDPAADNTKYRVQFFSVFEAEDATDAGTQGSYDLGVDTRVAGSPLVLASYMWEFSDVTEDSEGSHFDITSDDGMITLSNHLYVGEENSLKFDVEITGYEFNSDTAMLIFGFSIIQILGGNPGDAADTEQEDNRVTFNEGFFESETTAQAGGSSIDVGVSSASNNGQSMIYLAYEHFDGDLVHDPTMGVQASTSNPDGDDGEDGNALASDEIFILWDEDISIGAAGISTIFATIIALVLPVTLYRRKD